MPAAADYPAWRERLAAANDAAFWPIAAIDGLLASGQAQFWCDGSAALVTRIVGYPGGARVLEALAAAGQMDGLVTRIAPLTEACAKDQGLTHRMIAGRAGWARVHRDWRHYQTLLLKETI